ncbi:MAG: acyl-CoA dehydrogenase family protein [Sphingomonadales bacterium]|nr:acyl-CoA dehydrogenase family protein [Sphingomonadales bacterium]
MNFALSENEEMLKALAERFVLDRYDLDRRRAYQQAPTGYSDENWALLAELGLLAAALPESCGGLDVDGTSLAVLFEALGHGLVVEPVIENLVMAGRLLAATGAQAEAAAPLLGALATGEARVALADGEAGGRGGRRWIETRAEPVGDGWVLTGAKACVPAGAGVDAYLVTARTAGAPHPAAPDSDEGIGLWLVPADSAGLTVRPWRLVDGGVAVSLELAGVAVPAGARLAAGADELAAALATAQLARAAEALGIMERMLAETTDYLKTRQQFGVPLSSFQALQHRMVAQYAVKEQVRGLLNRAIVSWGQPDFGRAAAALNAYVASVVLAFGHEMIQFHGGMGITDELAIGHAHKRLMLLSRWPLSPQVAMERYAAQLGEIE